MSDVVISVENLSKRYLVGHDGPQESYSSLRDTMVRHGKNFARKTLDMARGRQIVQGDSVEEFWALKDVSFEVKRGEVLGIIGRNGAGKSTLLKVLSRITEPTEGRVTLNGRVASLLEVGTGFHPELTGRENIFLNGAILGMSRVEIKAKFDEIVDFAGVGKFLDTPVKRYSSGMYVRLAFAVAAHLEPEILIIDEVLAVGDAEFQKKCLGKMKDAADGGRTVLFVSHQMEAVQKLCTSCLLLQKGEAALEGRPSQVLNSYLSIDANIPTKLMGNIYYHIVQVSPPNHLDRSKLDVTIKVVKPLPEDAEFELIIRDPAGLAICACYQTSKSDRFTSNKLVLTAALPYLANGVYTLDVQLVRPLEEVYEKTEYPEPFRISRASTKPRAKSLDYAWRSGFIECDLEVHPRP